MSKVVTAISEIAVGAGLVALDIFAPEIGLAITPTVASIMLSAGTGLVMTGIGSILSGNPQGSGVNIRNPLSPWNVVYGRAKVGGTVIFLYEDGSNNNTLHMVFVLASHPCHSVDALLFDNKRVLINGDGDSYTPAQFQANIASISRQNDVVTVVLKNGIDLMDGDQITIQNVGTDQTLNGTFLIAVTSSNTFTYISGGEPVTVTNSGSAKTTFPNYGSTIHMETVLGNQTSTFPGLLVDNIFGILTGNSAGTPWTGECLVSGRTAVYLRVQYEQSIYASGALPNVSFLLSGKTGIRDPRSSTPIVTRPTVLMNGWGGNAHVGAYELGQYEAYNWGLNNDTTQQYSNPGGACDGDVTTYATRGWNDRFRYAGCIWRFAADSNLSNGPLYLNVLSSIQANSNERSAGIWYSIDGGNTWNQMYNSPTHPESWDTAALPANQDLSQVQVMAFLDAHDNMTHYVYDIQISNATPAGGNGFTSNPALCIADYLTSPSKDGGFGLSYGTDIPLDSLTAAANLCDEQIALAGGGYESRYTLNGSFPLSMKRGEILQNMLTSMAGRLVVTGGQYFIQPAGWVEPSAVYGSVPGDQTLLSSMTAAFKWSPAGSRTDQYNGAKGTYVSPQGSWESTDFPAYCQDSLHGYNGPSQYEGDVLLAADGGERRWLEIELPFTNSASMAQRIAKIALMRTRYWGTGTFAMNMALYSVIPLDVIQWTLPILQFDNKLLEVTNAKFLLNKASEGAGVTLGTEIEVKETDPSIYEWDISEELSGYGFAQAYNPQPPSLASITGGVWTVNNNPVT